MANSQASSSRSGYYEENYFSIDDILATHERIKCKFEVPVFRLGFLDMTTDNEHISPGAKLDLPFWLARVLCNKRNKKKHIADVEIPKQYKESYREILLADANVVDLHKLGPYYYTFGAQLLKFDPADASDIASSLVQTFQGRFRNIMDSSQNAYNEDNARLTAKLDEMEKDLFKAGQKGLNDFQDWETRRVEKLQTSSMVVNHKKRKRAALIE